MKNQFWLFRRRGVYYLEDAQTRRKESLHTRDAREARRLRDARNDSRESPTLAFSLARAYLHARDSKVGERTWHDVIERFCQRGKPQTQADRRKVAKTKPFDFIRRRKLLETMPEDFESVLSAGGVMTNAYLRCLQNLAQGLGWLPWAVLPPKLWPVCQKKIKRAITEAEHGLIVAKERNEERLHYYELLWEIGASQSDAASLQAENIDWETGLLTYERKKTGETACMRIGKRLAELLQKLPTQGPLFPKIGANSNNDRAAEFYRRCHILGIKGISLHSYRYAWAERAKKCGYPERFAQQALGHSSQAVHRFYARNAQAAVPPLDEFEIKQNKSKVLPFPKSSPVKRSQQPETEQAASA